MPNELSGQSVNVGASKIVELFTPKAENTGSADDRDLDALAVEDISVHGNPLFPIRLQPHFYKPPSGVFLISLPSEAVTSTPALTRTKKVSCPMAQADRVLSTSRTTASEILQGVQADGMRLAYRVSP
jgi:hypothetical protein